MTSLALFDVPESAYRRRRCPVCLGPLRIPNQAQQWVTYAVQREGWVKIGKTSQLAVRLRVLRLNGPNGAGMVKHPEAMDYGAPLVLVSLWPEDIEHELHVEYRDDHVIGEWFVPGARLRSALAAAATREVVE